MKKTFAFNIYNDKNGKYIDLVEDRTTNNLDKYFSYYTDYTKKDRKRVPYKV